MHTYTLMSAGNTRLDRTFRFDSKYPTEGVSAGTDTCGRCGGVVVYDAGLGESRCRSCDAPLGDPDGEVSTL